MSDAGKILVAGDEVTLPFAFGQTVYVAHANAYSQREVVCPLCFGKLFVTLILGDGSQQEIECDACGRGVDGPRGVTTEYASCSSVAEDVVVGMARDGDSWEVSLSRMGREKLRHRTLFATRDEAESRRIELLAEAEKRAEEQRNTSRRHLGKSLPWKVSYHRRCIADAERQIAWHKARLCEANEKIEKRERRALIDAARAGEGK